MVSDFQEAHLPFHLLGMGCVSQPLYHRLLEPLFACGVSVHPASAQVMGGTGHTSQARMEEMNYKTIYHWATVIEPEML